VTQTSAAAQLTVAERFNVAATPPLSGEKVGVARNVREGIWPMNGFRYPPAGDTTDWFIWAGGALSGDPGFFVPLRAEHLTDWCPIVLPYLALPPGWRFLLAPDHEDVWYDENLLLAG
jgi:hypothetical protein